MSAEILRDELLALPGVAEAEIDEGGESPSGVRIRLAPDADAQAVGLEVQRVLASHGMRSRVTDDEADDEAPPLPITTLPGIEAATEPAPELEAETPPPTPPPTVVLETSGLSAVRVEEGSEGIAVIVAAADGRSATRSGPATEDGMMAAVAAAAGDLAVAQPPEVLAIERVVVAGSEVITVVVERADGSRSAGAALVKASKAYAVARATWSALAD